MGEQLQAVIRPIVPARTEAECRTVVAPLAARLGATIVSADEEYTLEEHWQAVLHVSDPVWQYDGTDESYAVVVRSVLERLNIDPSSVDLHITPATANAVIADEERANEILPGMVWLIIEAWEEEFEPYDGETEELVGEGGFEEDELDELAELLAGCLTRVYLYIELPGQDRAVAQQLVKDLAQRVGLEGHDAAITGSEEIDSGALRIGVNLGTTDAEPAQAIDTTLDQLRKSALAKKEDWDVRQDDRIVRAAWTAPEGIDVPIRRIEIVAGPAFAIES